jgi:hypothetical protein
MRHAYSFDQKTLRKKSFGRPRHRWEDNIEMGDWRPTSCGSGCGPPADPCNMAMNLGVP